MVRILTADTALVDVPLKHENYQSVIASFNWPPGSEKNQISESQMHDIIAAIGEQEHVAWDEGAPWYDRVRTLLENEKIDAFAGGSAINALSTLTRSYPPSERPQVDVITAVGCGPFGHIARASCDKAGLTLIPPMTQEEQQQVRTARSFIFNGGDSRQIASYSGNVKDMVEHTHAAQIDTHLDNNRYDMIFIPGSLVSKMPKSFDRLVAKSRADHSELYLSLPTSESMLNANYDKIYDSMKTASCILGNEQELGYLIKRMQKEGHLDPLAPSIDTTPTDALLHWMSTQDDAKTAFISKGKEGACVISANEKIDLPIWDNNVKIVSQTGAGDASFGGFLTGMMMGYTPEKSAHLAMAYASACVAQHESQLHDPLATLQAAQTQTDAAGRPIIGEPSGTAIAQSIPFQQLRRA